MVRYLDGLLERAASERASDVHFEQKADRCVVRFRVDGSLRDVETLAAPFGIGVVARTKVLADLDVAAVRSPQDGRTTVSIRGAPTDLRISTTPTVHGESAVVRLLAPRGGVHPRQPELRRRLHRGAGRPAAPPYGLILVTGPTGSGKTTTLYAALRRLATRERKVLTVEDPIEYVFDGVNQTQVNEAAGVTFASSLRAFLRHDPDVILVGEIRDSETARLAVQAALTGHLVWPPCTPTTPPPPPPAWPTWGSSATCCPACSSAPRPSGWCPRSVAPAPARRPPRPSTWRCSPPMSSPPPSSPCARPRAARPAAAAAARGGCRSARSSPSTTPSSG